MKSHMSLAILPYWGPDSIPDSLRLGCRTLCLAPQGISSLTSRSDTRSLGLCYSLFILGPEGEGTALLPTGSATWDVLSILGPQFHNK